MEDNRLERAGVVAPALSLFSGARTPMMDRYRYLVLTEGRFGPVTSKTANSAIRYLPDRVVGVIDSTQAGRTAQEVLGFGGPIPILPKVEDGLHLGATALLIGIAPTGGQLPESWRLQLQVAMRAGLDIVSGLHFHLSEDPEIAALARAFGVRLWDLRKPPTTCPLPPVSPGGSAHPSSSPSGRIATSGR
jgi:uncharacterized NAD-dependent epimerase/dehydratase family protein